MSGLWGTQLGLAQSGNQRPWVPLSPSVQSSSLKIVAVNQRERYIRILNESPEETVDLSQHLLVQRVRDFPVCMYRFPEETLLEPLHHITVRPDLHPKGLRGHAHCATPLRGYGQSCLTRPPRLRPSTLYQSCPTPAEPCPGHAHLDPTRSRSRPIVSCHRSLTTPIRL